MLVLAKNTENMLFYVKFGENTSITCNKLECRKNLPATYIYKTLRVHTSYSDNYKNNAILDTTELVMRIR